MVSAKALVSERLQGYEAGADDYITKPFDEDELLAKVRVYLRLKSVEEVEQLKSNLLVLLGTETRTPLNGILPPLKLLMSEDDMSAEERSMFLDMAYQSARRLHRLIERCLTLSEMKAGRWEFQPTPADLTEVVQSAVDLVTPQAAERHVQVAQLLPDTAMTVLDVHHMCEVVTALLENAIRFSAFEGQVVVELDCVDGQYCLTVTDHGDGIAPDALPLVFEEFAPTDLNHHTEGQGLSLAIARQVVLAHNGTITVESTKGLATTFTVRLPIGHKKHHGPVQDALVVPL
jgi:signal transduction histidine kinase